MSASVVNFYRKENKKGGLRNPFSPILLKPVFAIVLKDGVNIRELVLPMERVESPSIAGMKNFRLEKYQDYLIITNYLLGEEGEKIRESWGLTREELKELIFEIYFCLIRKYCTCGILKKAFLILVGIWKHYAGRKRKK